MNSPTEKLLLASIHDVSPRFESKVDGLVELLTPTVGNRIALLVVPNHWGSSPLAAGSPFATKLRNWADCGFEIFLHGYFHRDDSEHASLSNRLRARWLTACEGEFLGLSKDEAAARIGRGRDLVESIVGRSVDGFVAPAWLYGRGALEALAESGIPIAESHWRVWSPCGGHSLARGPVVTWATRTRARRNSSLIAAAALRHSRVRALRIGVHPPDLQDAKTVASISRTLASASLRRRVASYRDLLGDAPA